MLVSFVGFLFVFLVLMSLFFFLFFFSSRRRHTRYIGDWSSDVCSSDLFHASSTRADGSLTRFLRGLADGALRGRCRGAVLDDELRRQDEPAGATDRARDRKSVV